MMKKEGLQELAQAAVKNIKSEADLNELKQMLTKMKRWYICRYM